MTFQNENTGFYSKFHESQGNFILDRVCLQLALGKPPRLL